jgi:hypothetical protein
VLADHEISFEGHCVFFGVVFVVDLLINDTHVAGPFVIHGAADGGDPSSLAGFLVLVGGVTVVVLALL